MDQIAQLAFPYSRAPQAGVSLDRLILTNETDTTRYCFSLSNDKCSAISVIETGTQKVLPELVSYITNPSGTTPLLVRAPPAYRKFKLKVSITGTNHGDLLIIVKSKKPIHQSIDQLLESPAPDTEVSRLEWLQLPIDKTQEVQRIVINDSFQRDTFSNCPLHVTLYDQTSTKPEMLFGFVIWADELENSSAIELTEVDEPASPSFSIADYRKAFAINIEDGPEFRQVLDKYEADIPVFKRLVTNTVDDLKSMDLYLRRLSAVRDKLIENLGQLLDLQSHNLVHRLNFKSQFAAALRAIFEPFEKNLRFFIKEVCDDKAITKMAAIASSTITNNEASESRKQFEINSKEYYNWLNKYLSYEKERPELKLLAKRKAFELSKFNYLNSLNMVSNNQYVNQLLENFFKFINLPYTEASDSRLLAFSQFKDTKASQDLLSHDYKLYINVLSRFNSEKSRFRQLIEASQTNDELTHVIQHTKFSQDDNASDLVTEGNLDSIFGDVAVTAVPLRSPDDQNAEMAGILYALGGQGKTGWHKEWVVLNKGRLIEYRDWRHGQSPINKPIDVALASIKPITYDKRQYCFEIYTSERNRHVFQVISEEERSKWMKALYNAGQFTDELATRRETKPDGRRNRLLRLVTENVPRVPANDQSLSPVSILSKSVKMSHLQMVRSIADSNNHVCVDCGCDEGVEWISINFLAVFCIKCSSCHRNLGLHISKIKSLKLDNFEDETRILLNYVNNNNVNSYLEHELKNKIKPDVDHETRLQFIKDKYANRKWHRQYPQVNDLLVRAVQKIEVHDVLRYIACGGDINMNLQISIGNKPEQPKEYKTISLFEYSLRKFVEEDEQKRYFVVSELLVLSGCRIDKELHDIGLSAEATKYWRARAAKR